MTQLFNETLEASGYVETWTLGETVGSNSQVVEDSALPSGATTSWGSQCLHVHMTTGEFVYVATAFSDQPLLFNSHNFIWASNGLASGENIGCFLGVASNGTALVAGLLFNNSGSPFFIWLDNRDGAGLAITGLAALNLNQSYRLEFLWDQVTPQVVCLLDGALVAAASITSSAVGLYVNTYYQGRFNNDAISGDCDVYFDNIMFDNSNQVAPSIGIVASAGSYAITGATAGLFKDSIIISSAGSYAISGQVAALVKDFIIAIESGAYTISGQAAALVKGSVLPAESGAYTISGQTVALNKGRTLLAESGTYGITGNTVSLLADRYLNLEGGAYVVTGTDIDLSIAAGRTNPGGGAENEEYPDPDWVKRQRKRVEMLNKTLWQITLFHH